MGAHLMEKRRSAKVAPELLEERNHLLPRIDMTSRRLPYSRKGSGPRPEPSDVRPCGRESTKPAHVVLGGDLTQPVPRTPQEVEQLLIGVPTKHVRDQPGRFQCLRESTEPTFVHGAAWEAGESSQVGDPWRSSKSPSQAPQYGKKFLGGSVRSHLRLHADEIQPASPRPKHPHEDLLGRRSFDPPQIAQARRALLVRGDPAEPRQEL